MCALTALSALANRIGNSNYCPNPTNTAPTPGTKIECDGATDADGNMFTLYCVNNVYFEAEIKKIQGGRPTIFPFGRCTFTCGRNILVPCLEDLDDRRFRFKRLVFFNVNPPCANFAQERYRKRVGGVLETKEDWEQRLRKHIEDNQCDANIYSVTFSPGDQLIEFIRGGQLLRTNLLSPAEAIDAYNGGLADLAVDPCKGFDHGFQTAGSPEVAAIIDDFEDGVLDPSFTVPLSVQTELQETNGALRVRLNAPGDGVWISAGEDNPMCAVFAGLDLIDFASGAGVSFKVLFENGDDVDLQLFEVPQSIRVKIIQKSGAMTREVQRHIPDVNLADVGRVQVDWLLDGKIQFEVVGKDGKTIIKRVEESISPLVHEQNRTTAYAIQGLDITFDPVVSLGAVAFNPEHGETQPILALHRTADALLLSWPISAFGFQLQSAPALKLPEQWLPLMIPPIDTCSNRNVFIRASNPAQFYRLSKP